MDSRLTEDATWFAINSDVEEETLRDTAEKGEKPGEGHGSLEIFVQPKKFPSSELLTSDSLCLKGLQIALYLSSEVTQSRKELR